MGKTVFRCRKCSNFLFDSSQTSVLNAHSLPKGEKDAEIECLADRSVLYLNENMEIPFIKDAIEIGLWNKGELSCPKCQSKIGSYNFVSRSKCRCNSETVPALQIISSRVDAFVND